MSLAFARTSSSKLASQSWPFKMAGCSASPLPYCIFSTAALLSKRFLRKGGYKDRGYILSYPRATEDSRAATAHVSSLVIQEKHSFLKSLSFRSDTWCSVSYPGFNRRHFAGELRYHLSPHVLDEACSVLYTLHCCIRFSNCRLTGSSFFFLGVLRLNSRPSH